MELGRYWILWGGRGVGVRGVTGGGRGAVGGGELCEPVNNSGETGEFVWEVGELELEE